MSLVEEPRLLALLLRRFTFRHWVMAPVQSLVLVLILALGVGVFLAMRLANRAVLQSFEEFKSLTGRESDWVITSPTGSLPEADLRELRGWLGERPISLFPVLEITAAEPAAGEAERGYGLHREYTILGLDLVALANFATAAGGDRPLLPEAPRSGPRPTVFIGEKLAQLHRWRAGDTLSLVIDDRLEKLSIGGILPRARNGDQAPESLLFMDVPEVQALAGSPGRIGRIECLVEPGAMAARYREEGRAIVNARAGDRWIVSSPTGRREAAARMTQALRLNLTLLSSLALLVGFYFVYQALDGAVVRRREEMATLVSLGFTEGTLRQAWLLEAALLGLAGGTVGGLIGWAGAQGAVRLVSRTVNALYHSSDVERAPLAWSELGLAVLLGIGFSVAAGWFPARDAARTPPAQALRRHAGTVLARGGLGRSFALAAVAVAAAFLPPVGHAGAAAIPIGGYVATLASVLAAAACAGPLLTLAGQAGSRLAGRSAPWRVAFSQLRRPALRQVIATSCLLSAVAMAGGMAVLVASFDATMRGWLARAFLADLYLSSEGAQSASATNRLHPETWKRIAGDPAVADFYAVQTAPIVLPEGPALLVGGDLGFIQRHAGLSWFQRPGAEMFDPARNEGLVLGSEAFLRRFRKSVGDEVTIPTPAGPRRLRLAGSFADYGNERGTLLIDRRHFSAWWGHELAATLTLALRPGVDPESMRTRLRRAYPELSVFTNRTLREQVLRVFRETFAITYALEAIGVAVAVTGLGLTLASIFLQRRPELATLRALAWTPREIARAATIEGLLLSSAGLAAGLVLSLVLGVLLVFVINRQTFGWTLEYHVPWGSLALLSLLVLAAGAGVSHSVGRWAARLPGEREE